MTSPHETTRPAIAATPTSRQSPAGSDFPGSYAPSGTQSGSAAGDQDPLNGHLHYDPQDDVAVEGTIPPQASAGPQPIEAASAGTLSSRSQALLGTHTVNATADNFPGGQCADDTQKAVAAGDQAPAPARGNSASTLDAPARDEPGRPAVITSTTPSNPSLLADPLLALAADVLSDLEKVRVANENRLRQLTRSEEDADGETRGFGLDEAHPDVARLAALVGMLADAEHKATLNLGRLMRRHPLGPWVAGQKGVGEKQAARLLAAIGDPYIRPEITLSDGTVEPSRPRGVYELFSYCGYAPGQKRQRGQRSNWSAAAKMRAFLIAESMLKAGNRDVYDKRKAATEGRVHAAECVRCGPAGRPALPGSPWSGGHRHADALRVAAKELLKELWREARRLHQAPASGQDGRDAHSLAAAGGHFGCDSQQAFAADGGTTQDFRRAK